MVRKIVLEDDSFMEEEIDDDYEVMREIRNASWPRDYELRAREPATADILSFADYRARGVESFDGNQRWPNRIRSRKPRD
jgi:hypothetical protein